MEQKEINTFFFIFHVTFPLFSYYKGRKSNVLVKPNNQSQTCLSFGVARKGA